MSITAHMMKLELVETRAIEFNEAVIHRYYCKPLDEYINPDDRVPAQIPLEVENYYRIDMRLSDGSKESFWVYVPPSEKSGDIGSIIAAYVARNEDYYINEINRMALERDSYRDAYMALLYKQNRFKWYNPVTWF